MVTDDFKKLANDIFRATSEADLQRLLAPLTAEETEELAQLVETGAMQAPVECEPAKARPKSELTWAHCAREPCLVPAADRQWRPPDAFAFVLFAAIEKEVMGRKRRPRTDVCRHDGGTGEGGRWRAFLGPTGMVQHPPDPTGLSDACSLC